MLENIAAMFQANPEMKQAVQQRIMESLQAQDPAQKRKEAIALAMRSAGKSLASTPGNFLTGAAAATGAGADAYAAGNAADPDRGKFALDLIGQVTNAQKADDLSNYRSAENERKTAADIARQEANNARIRALEERLRITDAYNQGRLEQGGRRLDITEDQGNRRIEQGDRNLDIRERQGDERIEVSRKNAETAAANAQRVREGNKSDPRKLAIDAADHLRKARDSIFSRVNEYSAPEEVQAAEREFEQYKTEFQKSLQAAGGGNTDSPVPITDKSQFDALPSGTRFIAPDGSIRVKP